MERRLSFGLILGSIMLLLGTSCSSSDDDSANELDNGRKPRMLTIIQADGERAPLRIYDDLTRTLISESDGNLSAVWSKGDVLNCCNLSLVFQEPFNFSLTTQEEGLTSSFTGTVNCMEQDQLALVYPSTNLNSSGKYTINLSGQDGSLGKLASSYHQIYGSATVTSVTDNTATASVTMKSLLTVCKFSFVEKNAVNNGLLSIDELRINYVDDLGNSLPYPETIEITANSNQDLVKAVAGTDFDNEGLIINTTNSRTEVYVALLPSYASDNQYLSRTFRFTVLSGGNTYVGDAKAALKPGEFVAATGLKLNKITNNN